jgi:hypothetical protein
MQKYTLLMLCKGVLLLRRCLLGLGAPPVSVEEVYNAVTHATHPLLGTFGAAALTPACIQAVVTAGCLLKKNFQARNMLACAIE